MKTFQVDFIDPSGKEDFVLFDAESIEAAESMFENEGFEIYDTNVYFEDKIKITKTDNENF